jgi:D-inositol-3-phosphate glycosyltransferase
MIQIAMLSYHTCPIATLGGKDTGGMNVYVRELTRQLGTMGIHVDVFTRSQDEHVPHVLHDLGYGNRVVHVRAGPEIPLQKNELVKFIPEFVQGVRDFSVQKGIHYDLLHSHYWMSGIAGKSLKEQWHCPIIHMFHTLGLMKQRVARSAEEREGDYRINGEFEVIRIADRIIAATPAELAQLQWLYQADPQKITIIPPGVDPCRFYPIPMDEAKEYIGVPRDDQIILFVGRIEPLKGVDTLIHAMALLRDQDFFEKHPFSLYVIGGEMDGEELIANSELLRLYEIRERYQVQNLVHFLGRRSQDSLPYFYSAVEAVVMPSFYESFGMVALEAMACGTPVVASQVGGLAFLVQDGETGYTVPADDPQALADRLCILLSDKQLRKEMGEKASEFARQYDWHRIADRIKSVYLEVLR